MKIDRFNDYNKIYEEVTHIPVLDFIISRDGKPLIEDGITKGRVKYKKGKPDKIQDLREIDQIAGVNKMGELVVLINYDKEVEIISNGIIYIAKCLYDKDTDTFLRIPSKYLDILRENTRTNYPQGVDYWIIGYTDNEGRYTQVDYTPLIPIQPTGWVNIKVDMEVNKRVKRYSRPLGSESKSEHAFFKFVAKLEEMQEISDVKIGYRGKKNTKTMQKRMATVMLLHYMNEIKDYFTPSSAGFLFESFISGLIPNSKVVDKNTTADIIADSERYQIKLLSKDTTYIKCAIDADNTYLDYYIIGLKDIQYIDLFIIDGNTLSEVEYQIEYGTRRPDDPQYFVEVGPEKARKGVVRKEKKFSVKKLCQILDTKKPKDYDNGHYYFKINLSDIDGRIQKISSELKDTVETLYQNISKLEYNVETIITGVDERGNIPEDITKIYDSTEDNIENIKNEIKKISDIYKH